MEFNVFTLKGSSRSYNNNNHYSHYSRYDFKKNEPAPNQKKLIEIVKAAGEEGIDKGELQKKMNFKHQSQILTAINLCNCVYEGYNRVFYYSKDLKEKYILFNNRESKKFFSKRLIAEYLNCTFEFVEDLLKTGASFNGYFVDELIKED